jgi:hypothetical protein
MGYDIFRFIKGSVKEEYLCIICHDVLKEPKMIDKCEHIFCGSCISEWISCQGICPIDRQSIKVEELREPIRSFKSLLGGLLISCDFASFGCNEFVKLDELEIHVTNCERNPKDMAQVECVCGLLIVKKELQIHQQNCVTYLKTEIDRIKSSVNDMKKVSLQTNSSAKRTIYQEWNDCNQEYSIIKCEMNENVKNEAIKLIRLGLNEANDNFLTLLVEKFTKDYKGIWFAFFETIEYDKFSSYNYDKESFLQLKIGSFHLTIFKSSMISMNQAIQTARTFRTPLITNKTMNDSMVEIAIAFSNEAISKFDDFTQISSAIRQRFAENFRSNWNCFAGNSNYGFSYIKKANTSVTLGYNNMTVIIWQCP